MTVLLTNLVGITQQADKPLTGSPRLHWQSSLIGLAWPARPQVVRFR